MEDAATDAGSRRKSVALWATMLFVASIPSENGVVIAGLGSLSRLVGVAAMVLTLWAAVSKSGVRLRAPSLFLVTTAALVTWLLTSYYWSAFPLTTLSYVFTLVQMLALVWLVHETCRSVNELASVMQAFVLGCYVLIGTTLVRVLGSSDLAFRDLGSFNPNGFAMVVALGLPMAWFLQTRDARPDATATRPLWLRLLNAFYPVAGMIAMLVAASRGGLLVMLTALLVIPLTVQRLVWWRRALLAAALAVATWALAIVAPLVFPDVQASIERLTGVSDELTSGTLTGRTTIWSQGIEFVERSPVVGLGAGTFAELHRVETGRYKSAHNAFLALSVGGGLIALFLFGALILLALISALRSKSEVRPYLVVLLAALVVAMLPANTDTDKFMWFVLALVGTQAPIYLIRRRPIRGLSRDA
ncbi:MAG: O-antigen ligase family protein [Trueperaceae bacterium]|nr:O-antigen ligase family protein [Trueperaceae bacterium]